MEYMLGSLITGLVAVAITWVTKYYEEKRSKRDLFLNAAIANWNRAFEIATARGKGEPVVPLEYFIFHMTKMGKFITDEDMNVDELEEAYKELDSVYDAFQKRWADVKKAK